MIVVTALARRSGEREMEKARIVELTPHMVIAQKFPVYTRTT